MKMMVLEISDLVQKFNLINKKGITEKLIDEIDNKKSIFRWSGQFSPKLIDYLLENYSEKNTVVLDPFCGGGTVLFESARKNLEVFGFDINPAAIQISEIATLSNLSKNDREYYLNKVDGLIFNLIEKLHEKSNDKRLKEVDFNIIKQFLNEIKEEVVLNIFTNVLMRFSIIENKYTISGLLKANEINKKIINELHFSNEKITVSKLNSKKLPLKNKSIDLCITSPPYPGVFDYYKNYKKIMFLRNWNISEINKDEIGQKNQGSMSLNLFKYGKDIIKVFQEINRTLKNNGRFILIVNKEVKINSKIIQNSLFLYMLASISGFELIEKQERVYKNRNNVDSIEDILHFVPTSSSVEEKQLKNIIQYILK